jgi:hypothetical protein
VTYNGLSEVTLALPSSKECVIFRIKCAVATIEEVGKAVQAFEGIDRLGVAGVFGRKFTVYP